MSKGKSKTDLKRAAEKQRAEQVQWLCDNYEGIMGEKPFTTNFKADLEKLPENVFQKIYQRVRKVEKDKREVEKLKTKVPTYKPHRKLG